MVVEAFNNGHSSKASASAYTEDFEPVPGYDSDGRECLTLSCRSSVSGRFKRGRWYRQWPVWPVSESGPAAGADSTHDEQGQANRSGRANVGVLLVRQVGPWAIAVHTNVGWHAAS